MLAFFLPEVVQRLLAQARRRCESLALPHEIRNVCTKRSTSMTLKLSARSTVTEVTAQLLRR